MAMLEILRNKVLDGKVNDVFVYMYGNNAVEEQKIRYLKTINTFAALYGEERDAVVFSAPGRTEIGGNHTDHNHGRVLAASVDLDVISVASTNDENIIRVKSEGFDKVDVIDLNVLTPQAEELGKSASLIRGIAAKLKELGYKIGGFDAYTSSNVLKGSGLSSSAAFEVLIVTMLNHLYNEGQVNPVLTAQISQYSENVFFGKPCGLMDQMASSVGGFVTIDFADTANPIIEKIEFDFAHSDYSLCIVDTYGNHADLTDDYAAIPIEMKSVASKIGATFLRETEKDVFLKRLYELREELGDRPLLRAIHFYNDNERVVKQVNALKSNDFETFKSLIIESGRSSFMYLQNVFTTKNPQEQGLSLAIALSEEILKGRGAWRVHGGGFAGTIQAFVPNDLLDDYKNMIEGVFGENSCYVLSIRPVGGTKVEF